MGWTFGDRLKEALDDKGWTQKVLADRSGVHVLTVGRLIRGERTRLDPETVRKLCRTLEVTSDFLLGLDDSEDEYRAAAAQFVST